MLDRLSEPARQALERAADEALAQGAERIGPDHVLLGLLGDTDGPAVRALARLGVEPRAIRAELLRIDGGDRSATPPSFAAWLGAALTQAAAEATADGRSIEVTDFLLALTHDRQSPAGWVLAELGIDGDLVRTTAEHLRLLDREIDRVGREMHDAAEAQQLDRAGELREQRGLLIAQRQRQRPGKADGTAEDPPAAS